MLFYSNTFRKRILSAKQLENRERINQKLIDFSSGETAVVRCKIAAVLKWARDRPDFDADFVHDLRRSCDCRGMLTVAQERALDKIISSFKIKGAPSS